MRKLSPIELVLAGIGSVIAGMLFDFGGKIGDTLLNFSPGLIARLTPIDVASVTLLVVGAILLAYGIYKQRKQETKIYDQERKIEIFTREELEKKRPLKDFLNEAKQSIVLIAVGSVRAIRGYENIYQDLIENHGIEITCLILNPNSELAKRLEVDLDWKGMTNDIETTLSSLQSVHERIDDNLKGKLKIKLYDRIPTIGLIILDPDSQKPTFQIVNYATGVDTGSRFAIIVKGIGRDEPIPKKYLEEYRRFLSSSKLYEEKKEFNPLVGKWG